MKSYVYDTIQNILFETNIFSILKLDSSEIRHTNMIEWLLTLNNYQGLKELIKWHGNINIDVSNIENNSITFYNDKPFNVIFTNSNIINRPDLLIKFICRNETYYILIENKIDAFENEYEKGKFQTELYYEEIEKLDIKNVFYIFLDAKKNDPKCDKYKRLDYNDLYNNIIKNITINNNTEKFIYKEYVNSLIRPIIIDEDFTVDTIYAIDSELDYDSIYTKENNNFIREYSLRKEHTPEEIRRYITLKYIYYCISILDKVEISEDIKQILFCTKKKEYKWKYNGVYLSHIDIIKRLCLDIKDNKDYDLLNKISNIKVRSDYLIVNDIQEEAKKDSWKKWLYEKKKTIEDYYIRLFDNFYVLNFIPNDTLELIKDILENTDYKLELE